MINKGVIVTHVNKSSDKTVVVMGVARSGTSMTAQVLHHLGVDMGRNNNSIYHERKDVIDLLENKKLKKFETFVAQQNEQFPLWGWKRPKAIEYVDLFEKRIRNPHYIIPFRDYASIAVRNNISIDSNALNNILDTHKRYAKVLEVINTNKSPMLLFSYEKANLYPHYFVRQVAKFVGVSDTNRIRRAVKSINPKQNAYIKINGCQGSLDRLGNGKVHGWAKKRNSSKPVTLKVLVNKKVVKRTVANKSRKDLTKIGNHAFSASFVTDELVVGQSYQIAVVDQQGVHLKNSPKTYVHQ